MKLNPKYQFNPLQILIQESHKRGIKVIGWFEYGFATSYNDLQEESSINISLHGKLLIMKANWYLKIISNG